MREHRRLAIAGAMLVIAVVVYPWAVGGLAARMVASKATARLGRAVTVGKGRAGLGGITLTDIRVAGTVGPDLVSVEQVTVPFGVALGGGGPVRVAGLRAHVVRGGTDDNVTEVIERLRGKSPATGEKKQGGGATPPGLVIESAVIDVRDRTSGLGVTVAGLSGEVLPGQRLVLRARGIKGGLALSGDEGPRFGADELDVQTPLAGMRPTGVPALRVKGGFATPLPSLSLTGIRA